MTVSPERQPEPPPDRLTPRDLSRCPDVGAASQVDALREAYRHARVDLAEKFEPQQFDEQLEMYQLEAKRLERLHMEVQLVCDALTGVCWIPAAPTTWQGLG